MSKHYKKALKKYAEHLRKLPISEIEAYRESFRFFDRSGKGYITPDDFRRALTQIQQGTPPREEDVAELMREYDINEDGKVTFEELVVITVKRRDGYEVDKNSQMRTMFKQFDKNANDILEKEEIAELVAAMGKNLAEFNEKKVLQDFDENKDGVLQFPEFVKFMKTEDSQNSQDPTVQALAEQTNS